MNQKKKSCECIGECKQWGLYSFGKYRYCETEGSGCGPEKYLRWKYCGNSVENKDATRAYQKQQKNKSEMNQLMYAINNINKVDTNYYDPKKNKKELKELSQILKKIGERRDAKTFLREIIGLYGIPECKEGNELQTNFRGINNNLLVSSMFGLGKGIFRPQGWGVADKTPLPGQTKTAVFNYNGKRMEIRDVYRETLEQELACIRDLLPKYKYVAMDTEFLGLVGRPIGEKNSEQQYQTLRYNVNLLKIIQLGLAFLDEDGNIAPGCPCWQFNFKFSLENDMYAQDSIELLQRSGIDFDAHKKRGIDVHDFGELLISSGLVLMPNITWITFHGGYDFGYLLKVLTCKPLPEEETSFFELLRKYFPSVYDVKYMAKLYSGFTGGLNQLADELRVKRIGQMHQAGSDSLLTGQVFFKMREKFMQGKIEITENVLYGLGTDRQIIYINGNFIKKKDNIIFSELIQNTKYHHHPDFSVHLFQNGLAEENQNTCIDKTKYTSFKKLANSCAKDKKCKGFTISKDKQGKIKLGCKKDSCWSQYDPNFIFYKKKRKVSKKKTCGAAWCCDLIDDGTCTGSCSKNTS